MKKSVVVSIALIAAASVGVVIGCGADTSKYRATRGTSVGAGGGGAADKVIDPATAGSIAGAIKLDGTPPRMPPIVMSATPQCDDQHDETVVDPRVIVGTDGGLKNCFVFVDGPSGYVPPDEVKLIDQVGCMYDPHVIGIQVGQDLEIKNSDPFLHNVHYIPKINAEQNIGFPTVSSKVRSFEAAETMIKFKCEVHPWMSAWVGVLDHPFYAVTGDDGSFQIDGVPPGTHNLKIWHEQFGWQTVSVTVATGQTATVNESYQS